MMLKTSWVWCLDWNKRHNSLATSVRIEHCMDRAWCKNKCVRKWETPLSQCNFMNGFSYYCVRQGRTEMIEAYNICVSMGWCTRIACARLNKHSSMHLAAERKNMWSIRKMIYGFSIEPENIETARFDAYIAHTHTKLFMFRSLLRLILFEQIDLCGGYFVILVWCVGVVCGCDWEACKTGRDIWDKCVYNI